MTEIFVAEEHGQLYDLWTERGERNLSVCHIDFHCDMRGLLVNRRRQKAYFVRTRDQHILRRDSGSYLAHAIMEGMVSSLRWVHDCFGGRKYDSLTVKYETDLSALPTRLAHRFGRTAEVELDYKELTFDSWTGTKNGEHLDIDWDGIAFRAYDPERIQQLTARVLDQEYLPPPCIYVFYSPGYSYPDRKLFEKFIVGLEEKFDTTAQELPPYEGPVMYGSDIWTTWKEWKIRFARQFRKVGIY
jgi:hypothetical protein